MNSVVNDGCNAELPVAMNNHENGFSNPSKLTPEIPTNRVENAIGYNRGNGAIICFVSYEARLAHNAKITTLFFLAVAVIINKAHKLVPVIYSK